MKEIIFLVEDNIGFAHSAKKGLEKELGFEVLHFETGEKMLDFVGNNPEIIPIVIVLDYYLNSLEIGAINGGEVMLKLKNPEKRINPFRKVPVVMLTSANELNTAITLLKKGAMDYILKDEAFFENLLKTINNIINIQSYQTEIQLHKQNAERYKRRLTSMSIAFILIISALVIGYLLK
jgi:two-component system response regulator AtoC